MTTDGAFAEYVGKSASIHSRYPNYVNVLLLNIPVVDSRATTPLPDKITFASAAPLACAGRTVWRGILETELTKGSWLALIGSGGGLGHLGIQFAKALGLMVVGVDARDEGLELSRSAGADVVVDARKGKEKVVEEVQKVTGGVGVDAAVTISDAREASGLACAVTKMHGTMIQIAQPDEVVIPFHEVRSFRVPSRCILSCFGALRNRAIADSPFALVVRFPGHPSPGLIALLGGGVQEHAEDYIRTRHIG